MVLSAPQVQNITVHFLIRRTEEGRSKASVLELPECSVEAATDEQAIELLQHMVNAQLAQTRVMPMEFPLSQPAPAKKSWMKYAGVFKGDPDFAEIAESLRAERRDESDESA